MLKIYGIPNCNTMKKTFDYLKNKGIEFEFHDYKKKGITEQQLSNFIDHLGVEVVLNKQGATYKQLSPEMKEKLHDLKEIKLFLTEKNSAIKRPILEDGSRLMAGFNIENLDNWLII